MYSDWWSSSLFFLIIIFYQYDYVTIVLSPYH
uniref:Uncharacterized protein n=1 Tax=Anguilla anguilla TaxID=7936 RepID=A0A0E9XLD4_ANGAN